MKDTSKKIGAVALAGVMVAGGTLQSGTMIANADSNSKPNKTAMDSVEVYDAYSLLKKHKTEWDKKWRPQLQNRGKYSHELSFRRQLYASLRNYNEGELGNKFDIIAFGDKRTVEEIIRQAEELINDDFPFNLTTYCYKDFENLKTGLHRHNDDRVANLVKPGSLGNYGGVPLKNFKAGNFYKVMIGDNINEPMCYIFLYAKK